MDNSAQASNVMELVPFDYFEYGWWNKFMESVPLELQCKIPNCTFAPLGHRQHIDISRNYSFAETRLIIQYLIHHNMIHYGKGRRVWEVMIERGYLTHRTPLSLANHFRRKLLKNIEEFNLPPEILSKFIEIRIEGCF